MKIAAALSSSLLAPLLLCAPVAAQDVALKVARVLPGPGKEPLAEAWILVRGGKVAAIAHSLELPEGVPRVELPGAWALPGLVDPWTELGGRAAPGESDRAFQTDVLVAERLDRGHPELIRLRAAGVTSCLLSPPGAGAIATGWGRVLRSDGEPVPDAGAVLRLVLGPAALDRDRAPTSRGGALALLRRTLTAAHSGASDADPGITPFAKGERAGLATVDGPAELRALLELMSAFGLKVTVALGPRFEPVDMEGLELSGTTFLLGPWDAETPQAQLRLAQELDRRGAKVAFTGRPPHGPALGGRLSAALAVRMGLPAEAALAGLTTVPAAALGIGDRAGTLEVGRPADITVLDGPPLDLSSKVLGVWVAGRRVVPAPAGREMQ